MLFKFFKRSPPPAPKPKKPKRRSSASSFADLPTQPSVLPEVTEGSEHSDWALWEHSVAALDSQMQSVLPSVKVLRHGLDPADTVPADLQNVEAYATVRKKDP